MKDAAALPGISVIVPVRAEPPPTPEFLDRILGGGPAVELIVAADLEAPRETLDAYTAAGARVLASRGCRGLRLAEAARAASGATLVFLHADTLLPAGWASSVIGAMASGAGGGAFRLAFAGPDRRLRWVAFWANLRTRLTRVPYGDQAPFVRRDLYERLGGHRAWPLLEDVDFGRRLKRVSRLTLLGDPVLTSPRRYLERGVLRTVLTNWRTIWRWKRGADPERLAEEYRKSF